MNRKWMDQWTKMRGAAPATANSMLTIGEAAKLIAAVDSRPNDTARGVKDRTKKRLQYNVKTGSLEIDPSTGRITFLALIAWARKMYPKLDLSDPPGITTVEVTGVTLHGAIGSVSISCLPNSFESIEQCRSELIKAEMKIHALEVQIQQLKLRAEKWDRLRERNTRNRRSKKQV